MLQSKIYSLVDRQLERWSLARKNFSDLKDVITREFNFDGFSILVQLNPARMISTAAKIDAKSLAARPCFLCAKNRPQEQEGIVWRNYSILVNPFPIFPQHLTIPTEEHTPQSIDGRVDDMLSLSKELPDFAVFYNGPKAGASAPDHHHFQAAPKKYLPIVGDYMCLKYSHYDIVHASENKQVVCRKSKNYLRTVFCLEGSDIDLVSVEFESLLDILSRDNNEEPMMNIVCVYENNTYYLFVLPRAAYRPWQYGAEGEAQLLISPGTVEMCGVFITPIKEHFEKLTASDVVDIFKQVSFRGLLFSALHLFLMIN